MEGSLAGSRALVLGGSGFIGWSLCQALLAQGMRVRCLALDRPPTGPDPIVAGHERVEWILGEFDNEYLMEKALPGVDYVYHLVCTTIPSTSNKNLESDLTSNVLPTLRLFKSAVDHDVQRVVFISSGGAVYGTPESLPVTESHPKNPICGYGIHKLAIEKYLHLFRHQYGLDYTIIRISNPYGKDQISLRNQGVIGQFTYNALLDQPLDIWGDGEVVRDFIYIDDVVEALLRVLHYDGPARVLNIGSGTGHSLNQIVRMMEEVLDRKLEVRYRSGRPVDVPVNVLDTRKACDELGWRPSVDIREGLRFMVDFGLRKLGL